MYRYKASQITPAFRGVGNKIPLVPIIRCRRMLASSVSKDQLGSDDQCPRYQENPQSRTDYVDVKDQIEEIFGATTQASENGLEDCPILHKWRLI